MGTQDQSKLNRKDKDLIDADVYWLELTLEKIFWTKLVLKQKIDFVVAMSQIWDRVDEMLSSGIPAERVKVVMMMQHRKFMMENIQVLRDQNINIKDPALVRRIFDAVKTNKGGEGNA